MEKEMTMYAVVQVGGKQYTVRKGDIITVEKQERESGEEFSLIPVLLISGEKGVFVGTPFVEKASVTAKVLGACKGEKVISYKYRRRKSSHTKKGHRQQLTRLEIKAIAA
jgi:large subunit ribosomal protein L21